MRTYAEAIVNDVVSGSISVTHTTAITTTTTTATTPTAQSYRQTDRQTDKQTQLIKTSNKSNQTNVSARTILLQADSKKKRRLKHHHLDHKRKLHENPTVHGRATTCLLNASARTILQTDGDIVAIT